MSMDPLWMTIDCMSHRGPWEACCKLHAHSCAHSPVYSRFALWPMHSCQVSDVGLFNIGTAFAFWDTYWYQTCNQAPCGIYSSCTFPRHHILKTIAFNYILCTKASIYITPSSATVLLLDCPTSSPVLYSTMPVLFAPLSITSEKSHFAG